MMKPKWYLNGKWKLDRKVRYTLIKGLVSFPQPKGASKHTFFFT